MPNFPLVVDEIDKLAPPSVKVAAEGALDQDATSQRTSHHSRSTSGTTSINVESPPVTPRSLTFNVPRTSFSSHSRPFYIPGNDQQTSVTPGATQGATGNSFPFPDVSNSSRSGINSVSTSVADFHKTAFQFYGRSDSNSRPTSSRSREAFALPRARPTTMYSSVVASTKVERDRQKSTLLVEGTVLEKPWVGKRDPATRWAYLITYAAVLIGVVGGAARCFFGFMEVPLLPGNMCVVMDENFDSADGVFGDNGKFFREVDMSGFGNGEFAMATASENNSYVKNGRLYITPTLTRDVIGDTAVDDGYVYNITGCTFNITQGVSYTSSLPTVSHSQNSSAIGSDQAFDLAGYTRACSAVSNITAGTIINPVQSARLTTRKTASIKYGRVEVRAKIPTGDWLWPAIWMLPVDNAYGPWPISGEIDIMEARGNGPSYPKQGSDFVRGSLNWGPLTWLNGVSKTFGWWHLRRGGYDQDFHTYALEWDKDFMRIYVDTRLHHMLDLRVKRSFFELGDFPGVVQNGTDAVVLTNPWANATKTAPFDQPFYLILNVAVGGTNGWFPDGNEKPWLDGSRTAMADFWRMRGDWLPTWPDVEKRSMIIDSVKMWQQC